MGAELELGGFQVTDKQALIALFDKNRIDIDVSKNELTVKVNGAEVTGTEGGQVIFKFGSRGQLVGIVVWNKEISEQKWHKLVIGRSRLR